MKLRLQLDLADIRLALETGQVPHRMAEAFQRRLEDVYTCPHCGTEQREIPHRCPHGRICIHNACPRCYAVRVAPLEGLTVKP